MQQLPSCCSVTSVSIWLQILERKCYYMLRVFLKFQNEAHPCLDHGLTVVVGIDVRSVVCTGTKLDVCTLWDISVVVDVPAATDIERVVSCVVTVTV